MSMYWYTQLRTFYLKYIPSTHYFSKYVHGTDWYVLCLPKYYRGCCFMSYDSGKQYCVRVTCMLWCSYAKSVPLLVSTYMPSFWYLLGMYWYILVCAIIHFLFQYIQVSTFMYPVPVQQFMIPDVRKLIPAHDLMMTTHKKTLPVSPIPLPPENPLCKV
jgi:hypothetical protein